MSYKIKVKKVHPDAQLPFYATEGSSGADLYSVEDLWIFPGERKLVDTGLVFQPEIFCDIQIRPRSGLALKNGLTILNAPATIDSDYIGNIKVLLINYDKFDKFYIEKGDRIAQVVCNPLRPEFIEVDIIDKTLRGIDGFGSSGIK